jgi:hypothetical protein
MHNLSLSFFFFGGGGGNACIVHFSSLPVRLMFTLAFKFLSLETCGRIHNTSFSSNGHNKLERFSLTSYSDLEL